MADANDSDNPLAMRVAILIIPIAISARLLELIIPKPIAWPLVMAAWMVLIYWVPSRSNVSLKRWLVVVAISTALAVLAAIVIPDWL